LHVFCTANEIGPEGIDVVLEAIRHNGMLLTFELERTDGGVVMVPSHFAAVLLTAASNGQIKRWIL
jgi:hypothetical protein